MNDLSASDYKDPLQRIDRGEPVEETPMDVPALSVEEILVSENCADLLPEDALTAIARQVVDEFEIDKVTQDEWIDKHKRAIELARMERKPKSFPWPDASNVIYPLITNAMIQFSSRAISLIVQNDEVVKGTVIGPDPDGFKGQKAKRVAQHMSTQLLYQGMDADRMTWFEELDGLLNSLSIVGHEYRKTLWDAESNTVDSIWVRAEDMVFDYNARSFYHCRRHTHVFDMYKNEIIEKIRLGMYSNVKDFGQETGEDDNLEDSDRPYTILEQHRYLDLDQDGYKEPYIVTVLKSDSCPQILRIRHRIKSVMINDLTGEIAKIIPKNYFTQFRFLIDPRQPAIGLGYGVILISHNETINTLANQIIDAGTLSNANWGIMDDQLAPKGRNLEIAPGEFMKVRNLDGNLSNKIFIPNFPGPSMATFNMLNAMVEIGEKTANTTDIFQGNVPGANVTATTTMAMVDQGLKVLSGIMQRIHWSLRREFSKIFELNRENIDQMNEIDSAFSDEAKQMLINDYRDPQVNIAPVSDPKSVSEIQKISRSEISKQFLGSGLVNDREIVKRMLERSGEENVEALLVPVEALQQPRPEVQMQMAELQLKQAEIEIKNREQALKEQVAASDHEKKMAEVKKIGSEIFKNISEVEIKNLEPKIQLYEMKIAQLEESLKTLTETSDKKTKEMGNLLVSLYKKQNSQKSGNEAENGNRNSEGSRMAVERTPSDTTSVQGTPGPEIPSLGTEDNQGDD
ncbi:MAG: hypothetical protein PHQ41_08345 [Candidatus Cloacimonetes bacterium]|jgi:chaperonin GroES|nr:hypothetical protein [Candidatus Cloacimonadota bacterium]